MIPLFKVDRTYRHLQRLREILALAVRYGFEDVVAETRLRGLVKSLRLRIDPAVMERSRWERIRMLLEGLGPTFVKFGQLLSNRPDLVPPPLLKELGHLQDRVAPFPFEEVEANGEPIILTTSDVTTLLEYFKNHKHLGFDVEGRLEVVE